MANMKKVRSNALLLLTSIIWGTAFVAQSVGSEYLGPFAFNACRGLLAAVFLFVLAKIRPKDQRFDYSEKNEVSKLQRRLLFQGGVICGLLMFAANVLQQAGLSYTTAGKSGFITSLYVILVPIFGLFRGKRLGLKLWVSIMLAAVGLFFLCITDSFTIGIGDGLTLLCAVGFAFYILAVDKYAPYVDCVWMSCIQFTVLFICSTAGALLFETTTFDMIKPAVWSILYAGILSSGVAYTLQIVAQRHTDPTSASLIMSLESVFAVLGGLLLLNQHLVLREIVGCIIMFAAILLSQLPSKNGIKQKETG